MSDREVEALVPRVYDELRAVAARLHRNRPYESIQPTILVHEAWLRLANWREAWQSEAHFRAVAAKAMRQILLDRARRRMAEKRGGGVRPVTLSGVAAEDAAVDVVELDQALTALEALDPMGSRIVELRYLGGMSIAETAEVLGISQSAVQASWRLSRAWLEARLGGG